MRVLVSGGAGYIGSHTAVHLLEHGHEVVVVDDFANSKPAAVDRLEQVAGGPVDLHAIDLCDEEKTERVFAAKPIDAVVHFAGLKAVGQSVGQPVEYYRNNLTSTLSLVRAMRMHDVGRLVFSSSATVYGDSAPNPYHEDYQPLSSSSPYGWTKVMIERILTDVAAVTPDMKVALLRYFNPVGAHPSGRMGEDPQGVPNNLMPFVAQVAVGRREQINIFGGDYPTADGTCERDYIHVQDLASGHVAALEHLDRMEHQVRAFNLGSGTGTSVLELVHAFARAVGHELPYEIVDRRAGDLPAYWADPSRARDELGWQTEKTIDDMCADTWRWQSANPQGY